MFRFDRRKIDYNESLGRGGFATVYPYGKDKKWVVKVIECKNEEELLDAISEVVLGFNLDHPSVLPVEGYYLEKWRDRPHGWTVYLKLQRMETDLQKVINHAKAINKYLKKEDIISYFYDIVSGLEYLNNKKIAHRDLKPSNLLLDSSGKVKLSDIGLANFVSESSFDNPISRRCGTQKYKAPELQNRENHIKKKELFQADIWSLGMILLDLCRLVPTFNPADPRQTDKEKQDALNDDLEMIEDILDEEGISELLRKYLLSIKPSERMSVGEIKEYLEKNYHDILIQRGNKKENFKPPVAPSNNNNQSHNIENGQKQFKEEEEKVEIVSSQRSMNGKMGTLLAASREMQAQWHQYFTFTNEVQNELKVKAEEEKDKAFCFAGDNEAIQMLRDLSASLVKNDGLKDLIDLSIDLGYCYNITDNGIGQIGRELGMNFSSIENLQIIFSGSLQEKNKQISNGGVEDFSRNLFPRMTSLRELTVHFEYCDRVANVGLKTLVYEITKNLRKLQALHLHFVCCNMITKEAFAEAAGIIKEKLGELQSLTLDFYYCKQIPADIKTGVKSILKNIKKVVVN